MCLIRSRWSIETPCTLYLEIYTVYVYLYWRLWFWVWGSWDGKSFTMGFSLIQSFEVGFAYKLHELYEGTKSIELLCTIRCDWHFYVLNSWKQLEALNFWAPAPFSMYRDRAKVSLWCPAGVKEKTFLVKFHPWIVLCLFYYTNARVVPCHYSVLTTT